MSALSLLTFLIKVGALFSTVERKMWDLKTTFDFWSFFECFKVLYFFILLVSLTLYAYCLLSKARDESSLFHLRQKLFFTLLDLHKSLKSFCTFHFNDCLISLESIFFLLATLLNTVVILKSGILKYKIHEIT